MSLPRPPHDDHAEDPPVPESSPASPASPVDTAADAGTAEALRTRDVRRRGLSVGIATGLYGISFGALATASGLDVWQAMVLSLILFSGGSQFAFVGVIGGGGSGLGAALASILLGIRNTLYGLTLSPVLGRGGLRGMLRTLVTIDESAAVAASGTTPGQKRAGFWSAGLAVYLFWNLFSLVGAVAGQYIADPSAWGLDAAASAAFLGLLWPRLRDRETVAIAVAAAFVALVTTPALPAGLPVLAAALVAVVAGLLPRRHQPGRTGSGNEAPSRPQEDR
jgi:predicted branched-subunit amino acid permease